MNLLKGLGAMIAANLLLIFVQFAFAGLMIGGNDLAVNLRPYGPPILAVAERLGLGSRAEFPINPTKGEELANRLAPRAILIGLQT